MLFERHRTNMEISVMYIRDIHPPCRPYRALSHWVARHYKHAGPPGLKERQALSGAYNSAWVSAVGAAWL
jgi:hypothetical protein